MVASAAADTQTMTGIERALELVADGQVVGLGSGRAASAFVRALGERVAGGLRVRGVPTSRQTAAIARESGIPLVTLDDIDRVDLTVDGADEVDPRLDLIKGNGGALVREKVVAAASTRLVILVGPEKLVPVLGSRGKLPVEVLPFAAPFCRRLLREAGCRPEPRLADGRWIETDNGNYLIDCGIGPIDDPRQLNDRLTAIPGVVGTGLFLGMAEAVFVDDGDTSRVLRRTAGG